MRKALYNEYARPHIAEFHVASPLKQKNVIIRCVAPRVVLVGTLLDMLNDETWSKQQALVTIDISSP
jgi:hypothetical protein